MWLLLLDCFILKMEVQQPLEVSGSTHPMTQCHTANDFHLQQSGHKKRKYKQWRSGGGQTPPPEILKF
jgi:hypothetical protein